jgi:DNA-binding Xre family transcriptional regulator
LEHNAFALIALRTAHYYVGDDFRPDASGPKMTPLTVNRTAVARRPTFIRAWRKSRDMTLAVLGARLKSELGVSISEGQISRIERCETPYHQDILEAIATVLQCEPADLISRDPTNPQAMDA